MIPSIGPGPGAMPRVRAALYLTDMLSITPERTSAPRTSEDLDLLFGALADATRRGIVERLAAGEATVSELAAPFAISLPAISRHLKVLERASLITRSHEGRWRRARLSPAPLASAATWLERHERLWAERFGRLDDHLARLTTEEPMPPTQAQTETETGTQDQKGRP
jgi:DNA-binding transcriptional ArsR family regulator